LGFNMGRAWVAPPSPTDSGPRVASRVGPGIAPGDLPGDNTRDIKGDITGDITGDRCTLVAIDRVYLARYTLGNGALEREVLELFALHAPRYLERLRAAETGQSWIEAVHTIKGSALAVGACRLARSAALAQQIDVVADARRNAGQRDQALEAIAAATAEACGTIAAIIAKA
jgi:HPt (histidine-containing phosphotransfer) domain-containing protein